MNPSDIPRLLAEIALADPRVRREDPTERRGQIKMWAGILTDVPYDFAIHAAQRHYAESQWPILPANISTRWTTTVRDRMERHTDPDLPIDPDNEAAWRTELRATRQAVAVGELQPADHHHAQGQRRPIAALIAGIGQMPGERTGYIPADVRAQIAKYRPGKASREAAVASGDADPLSVDCGWCRAYAGQPCRRQGRQHKMHDRPPHPSRVDAARAALGEA